MPKHWCWRSWSWPILWRSSRTNINKRYHFHYRELESRSKKSRDVLNNQLVWPWSLKWAGQKIREFCRENSLVISNTLLQPHRKDSTHEHYQMVNTKIRLLCSRRWIYTVNSNNNKKPGSHFGSDHHLLPAKFMLKLKNLGKIMSLFSLVPFGHSVVSDFLRPHELQHARLPYPS